MLQAHLMVNVEVHLMVNTIPLDSLTAVTDKAEKFRIWIFFN